MPETKLTQEQEAVIAEFCLRLPPFASHKDKMTGLNAFARQLLSTQSEEVKSVTLALQKLQVKYLEKDDEVERLRGGIAQAHDLLATTNGFPPTKPALEEAWHLLAALLTTDKGEGT